jgi:hypothetical protein
VKCTSEWSELPSSGHDRDMLRRRQPSAWSLPSFWRGARFLRRVSSVPHSCFRGYETVLCHTLRALCAYVVMTWCVDAT